MAGTRIKGITIEIDGDATKLTNAVRKANNEIRASQNQLSDVNRLLRMDPSNTVLLTQKYEALQSSIGATSQKLTTLRNAQAQMAAAGQTGTPEFQALQREIAETEIKLKSLEKEFKNFGSVAAQQVANVGQKMKSVGQGMTQAGTMMLPATFALTAAGKGMVEEFYDVSQTMRLTNKTMNNSADQAALLENAMKSAAKQSVFGMEDASAAALNFARSGLTAEEAAAAIAPAMNLAAGEAGQLESVSAGLTGAINGFGDSYNNTAHYADVFAAACNNSKLDIETLCHSMGVAAPVFRTAGKSVEDAALMIGVMADANIDADKAANALKTGMARLAAPTKQAKDAMDEYGITMDQIWNEDGSMKSVEEIQRNLHNSFAGLSEQEQMAAASAIFGKNQMAAWLALINTAPEHVDALSNSIHNCTGLTNEMASEMMSGPAGAVEQLKSSWDTVKYDLGGILAEVLLPIVEKLQEFVNWLDGLDESQKKIVVTIGTIIAVAGPLLIILGTLTTALGSILTLAPKLVGAFGSIGGVFGKLSGLFGGIGSGASSAASGIGSLGSAAGSAAGGASSAAQGIGALTKNALGFIALGAGILLAAAGVALLAQSAIALGKAGPEAAFALVALVGVIALFAAGAAALGPALTAGAVGLLAFGAAILMVGVGILAATAGIALLATQLPTIATWGGSAATAIVQLGAALLTFTPGALAAGAGLAVLAAGILAAAAALVVATAAVLAFTVAVLAFSAGILVAAASVLALAAAIAVLAAAIVALGAAILKATQDIIKAFELIKQEVKTTFEGVKTTISTMMDGAWSAIQKVLNTIKNAFTTTFNNVKTFMQGVVNWLKGIFNFEWSLPKIKLPHFSISGSFSLDPPKVPSINVQWYKKAMENGMILSSPTIFGAAGGKLLGAGEAGPEAIVGVSSLRGMIQDAVGGVMGDIVIPVSIGGESIQTLVVDAQTIQNYRSGGR